MEVPRQPCWVILLGNLPIRCAKCCNFGSSNFRRLKRRKFATELLRTGCKSSWSRQGRPPSFSQACPALFCSCNLSIGDGCMRIASPCRLSRRCSVNFVRTLYDNRKESKRSVKRQSDFKVPWGLSVLIVTPALAAGRLWPRISA